MPAVASLPQYLNVPTIAKALGVDVIKVRAWIASGELKGFNACKSRTSQKVRWLVNPSDFEAFCLSRQPSPPTAPRRRRTAESGVKKYF